MSKGGARRLSRQPPPYLAQVPRVDAVAAAPQDAVAPCGRAQLLFGALLVQVRARLKLVRRAEGQRALREAEEAAARGALNVELVLLPQLLEVRLAAVRLLKATLGRHLRKGPGRGEADAEEGWVLFTKLVRTVSTMR